MASSWKTVRVFLSSTFRDMHAERDHLVKVTFPALREKLLPFRVELYDIDLRWGITEDEAKNEKVIGLCLDQVDKCRPFFLAFLGHRYGYVPAHISEETQKQFPFVKAFPGVSVTELELRHGAMLHPDRAATLILLRKEDALSTIPEATRKRDFVEADPKLQQKLDALRTELEAGPISVQPYWASWDPKRYDRVNRTEGKLDGLDGFGKQVEDWLWQAINKELQLPEAPAEFDPLDAEADLHERFLEMRTRIYIGRDDLYGQLREFALASGEIPLLLSGASGLGKSAALARFVRDFHKEQPDVFVLPHFVGASPRTTSLAGMLQRLTQELQRKFPSTMPAPVADAGRSLDEIIRTFIVCITSVPESARVVLVFDALNQLDADSRAESIATRRRHAAGGRSPAHSYPARLHCPRPAVRADLERNSQAAEGIERAFVVTGSHACRAFGGQVRRPMDADFCRNKNRAAFSFSSLRVGLLPLHMQIADRSGALAIVFIAWLARNQS